MEARRRDDPADVVFDSLNHIYSETDPLISRSSSRNGRRQRMTYEDAIQYTGYGLFHYKLLILCGLALCSNAIQFLSVSFVLPLAVCEMRLTNVERDWITAIVFTGMLIGALFLAAMADLHGRKIILLFSLAISSVFGLASTFAQGFWLFLFLRLFTSIGCGASIPVIFSYFVEFQPKHCRGKMVSILAFFWILGGILVSSLAKAMLPYKFGLDMENFHYNSWHIFLSLCTLTSMISVIFFVLMPESPKYLTEIGHHEKAYEILQSISDDNQRKSLPSEFENHVNHLYWSIDHMTTVNESVKKLPATDSTFFHILSFCTRFMELLQCWMHMFSVSLRKTTLTMFLIFCLLSFGYFGLVAWLPELFRHFKHQKSEGTICNPINQTENSDSSELCYRTSHYYIDHILMRVFMLPGTIITVLLIDKIGRKFLLALSMILCIVGVFFVWLVSSHFQMIALLCLFLGVTVVGWNVLYVLLVELFPTMIRCTTAGFLTAMGYLGALCGTVLFDSLVGVNCAVPVVLIVVTMVPVGLLCFLLPNSCQTQLL